jgi:hypothetical protein
MAWVRVEDVQGRDRAIYARAMDQLNNPTFFLWTDGGGGLGVNAWNADHHPDFWLGASPNQPVITKDQWVFIAARLKNGGTSQGDLRLIVDDRPYDLSSQMVNGAEEGTYDFLGVNLKSVLDEVVLCPRALSDSEIQAIRRQGIEGKPVSAVAATSRPAPNRAAGRDRLVDPDGDRRGWALEDKASPAEYPLIPVSGADGAFETIKDDEVELRRGSEQSNGSYAPYMYFRLPEKAPKSRGPVYVEVVYRDAGQGQLGLQYNAAKAENYSPAEAGYGRLLIGQDQTRRAVFQLAVPDFRHAQNLQADLRLVNPDPKTPLQIVSATLYLAPTPLFERNQSRSWLQPYKGPTPNQNVNAKTLHKKVLCGYQGWFRAPGDDTERGWVHWSRDANRIAPETLSVEMWPDLTEFTDEEKFPAPGFTYPNGQPAYLFSSAHQKTVERHFDWMAKYGIDGVLVQRFVVGLQDSAEAARVLGYARLAANRTGRVFAVEYDMSGMPSDELYDRMVTDWKWLVDEMKITADPRYLHHAGKPVLAIWGFYSDRFDAGLANRIIDFFKNDPRYRVCLIGGCQWQWRTEQNLEWAKVFRRFDVISPWNVGNVSKQGDRLFAATQHWAADLVEARQARMLHMPVIYPGFSWDNLQRKASGSTVIPRLGGEFFWRQFATAADLGLDLAKVAMFDEVDEGTAIFKVTNTPPTQAHFVTFEKKPSDWYLRLTGEGTKLLHKQRRNSPTIPIRP